VDGPIAASSRRHSTSFGGRGRLPLHWRRAGGRGGGAPIRKRVRVAELGLARARTVVAAKENWQALKGFGAI